MLGYFVHGNYYYYSVCVMALARSCPISKSPACGVVCHDLSVRGHVGVHVAPLLCNPTPCHAANAIYVLQMVHVTSKICRKCDTRGRVSRKISTWLEVI